MEKKRIHSALISVYNKDGLDDIVRLMHELNIVIYSTGGTQEYIEQLGVPVVAVETITSYPSILGGRVKTLHPKIFGGILAIRNADHLSQLAHFEIPMIDLVIVDLYPFVETLMTTDDEALIIEKIDIGGVALIRAAAKNFKDVVVIPSKKYYNNLSSILSSNALTDEMERKYLAQAAFQITSEYDNSINNYFLDKTKEALRYGENPHQKAWYDGNLTKIFKILSGKTLSYNNLVDVEAAILLMSDFKDEKYCFAILKHTNVCGFAQSDILLDAWRKALAGDPVSAFGGVIITNKEIDIETAGEIDHIFYEVLIAPSFTDAALDLLVKKKNRILLKLESYPKSELMQKTLLDGNLIQERDHYTPTEYDFEIVTNTAPTKSQNIDLIFASKIAKHLKSNAIVLIKDKQLIGMGCGQTSRVDACEQAINKANKMGFNTVGAVMASEAFFPFPDCVELAGKAKVAAIIQPGGSINDDKSILSANDLNIAMVLTGKRHFKH